MPPITSPLDGSLFRFDVGHGPGTLGIASSDFDARDSGYRSKFALHVARQLLDDPAALDRALISVPSILDADRAHLIAVNRTHGSDLGVALDYRTDTQDPRVVASSGKQATIPGEGSMFHLADF